MAVIDSKYAELPIIIVVSRISLVTKPMSSFDYHLILAMLCYIAYVPQTQTTECESSIGALCFMCNLGVTKKPISRASVQIFQIRKLF